MVWKAGTRQKPLNRKVLHVNIASILEFAIIEPNSQLNQDFGKLQTGKA